MTQPDATVSAQRSSAMTALMGNVDRLLNDCDTLMAARSYASAASLATIAFEECGKAYALRFDLAPSDRGIDRAKYYHAVAMVALSLAILKKYDIDERPFSAAILPYAQAVTEPDASASAAETVKSVLQTTLAPIMKAQSNERNLELRSDVKGLVAIGKLVQAGEVGAIRARGFQVETDSRLTVLSDPTSAGRDVAERWSWAAEGVLHLLQRDDHRHPDSQEIAVLIEALGQDLPAQRLAA